MIKRISSAFVLTICFMLACGSAHSQTAPIEYKQTMTSILSTDQFMGWPEGKEDWGRNFRELSVSLDGSRIAFTIQGITFNHTRIFSAKADGSDIIGLPAPYFDDDDKVRPMYPVLDPLGQRLFFRMGHNVYYCSIDTLSCNYAVVPKSGQANAMSGYDSTRPFSLTTLGDQTYLYFRHNDGWSDGRYRWGIFSAPLGGNASKAMSLHALPGDTTSWNRLGSLSLIGSAALSDEVLFTWWHTGENDQRLEGMYRMHGPTLVPHELHNEVYQLERTQISADGTKALYIHRDSWPAPNLLWAVNLNTGGKTFIRETTKNFRYPTISPSGRYAFFSVSDDGGHMQTRFDLGSGDQRDTFSFLIDECRVERLTSNFSDITADDRYYFIAGPSTTLNRIHRVDMAPDDFSQAPNISAIEFSPSYLLADGTSRVTIKAHVSDAQGLETISWVRLTSMVGGLERPEGLSYQPIAYSSGIRELYDDGVKYGDEVAGDGVFTQNDIRADLRSNFYDDFTSPKPIGIRIVAKDQDRNYVMVDTVLYVAPVGAQTEFTVLTAPSTSGGGTVQGEGKYTLGQQVKLTAVPSPGFAFKGWMENNQVVSTDETYTFTATKDRNLVANFQRSGSTPGVMMLLLDDAE